jgi:hypothetical protein
MQTFDHSHNIQLPMPSSKALNNISLRPSILNHLLKVFTAIYQHSFRPPARLPRLEAGTKPYDLYFQACIAAIEKFTASLPELYRTPEPPFDALVVEHPITFTYEQLKHLGDPFRQRPLRNYLTDQGSPASHLERPEPPNYEFEPPPRDKEDMAYWRIIDRERRSQQREEKKEYERQRRQYEKDYHDAFMDASPTQLAFVNTPLYWIGHELLSLGTIREAITLPAKERFEGTWMVAPSGSGKTNALIYLILKDLELVDKGLASIIVIDSTGMQKGRLLHYLSRYEPFRHRLKDRIVVVDPSYEYPLALNLFDMDMDAIRTMSPDARVTALGSAREMIQYILGGLLGSEMTDKQRGLFGYLIQALMHIPDATIYTLAELLEDEGYDKHREHILQIPNQYTVNFFEKRFRQQYVERGSKRQPVKNSFATTKQEIFWRIDAMLNNPMFQAMFSHKKNKLDMYKLMGEGKVILINTHRALMQRDGMETFGRFMLAKIFQAAERRLDNPEGKNLKTFVYIDEAHNYLANEPKIITLLDELARKNNIAFTFTHQRPDQVSPTVLDAFSSTALRFASRNEHGVEHIAQRLRVPDPSTITNLHRGQFAFLFREINGQRTGVARFPPVDDKLPLMSETAYQDIQNAMRKMLSGQPDEMPHLIPPEHFDEDESVQPGTGDNLE